MTPEKILMRGPNWVGDAVLAVPAMKAMRRRFPQSEITLLVRPWVAGLFTSAPFIDALWKEEKPAGAAEWIHLTRRMRRGGFSLGVLFPNSFESALTMFLGGVRERVGYATDGRGWMLTTSLAQDDRLQHQVQYYFGLVKTFDSGQSPPPVEIGATEEERANARKLLNAEGVPYDAPFLALNPGAAYGSAKRWSARRFAEAADALSRDLGLKTAIIGSERERDIAEEVQALMKSPASVLTGRTSLETLIGVLAEASLMITNDSGPMHIAAALGTPTVAIFGSTDDRVTGPCGPHVRVVKQSVECSPCLLRECPIDHRCMDAVTAAQVYASARDLMNA